MGSSVLHDYNIGSLIVTGFAVAIWVFLAIIICLTHITNNKFYTSKLQ